MTTRTTTASTVPTSTSGAGAPAPRSNDQAVEPGEAREEQFEVHPVPGYNDDAFVGSCLLCPATTKRMGSERKAARSIRAHVNDTH